MNIFLYFFRSGSGGGSGSRFALGHTGKFLKLTVFQYMASAVEDCFGLDLQKFEGQVAVLDGTAGLQEKKVLCNDDAAFELSAEINVLAEEIALYVGVLTNDQTALGDYLSVEVAIDADISCGNDFTFERGSCSDSAHSIGI